MPRRPGRFLTAQPRTAVHGRLAGRKGVTLTALLDLEPGSWNHGGRPAADFADATWAEMHDRARFIISCRNHTRIC